MKRMKRKIICIGIISLFLLSGLSLTAVGIEKKDETVPNISVLNNKPNLYIVVVTLSTTTISLTLSITIANEMYNIHVPVEETFDVALYFNNEAEPYRILENVNFGVYAPGKGVQMITLADTQNFQDYDFPEGYFTITIVVDPDNRIDETTTEDNIYTTEQIKSKSRTFNPIFDNFLARLSTNYPNMFSILRALLKL